MNLILLGDVHLRSTVPEKRRDDFLAVQYRKMQEVFEAAKKYQAPIICTGDLFDKHDPPISLLIRYLPLFLDCPHGFYTAIGNHDVYGASLTTLDRSALGLMAKTRLVRVLNHDPIYIKDRSVIGKWPVVACGVTYMDDAPLPELPETVDPDAYRVLVSHSMVLLEKMYREQDDFVMADAYLDRYPNWNLLLCGHYHYRFKYVRDGRLVLNPGAVVRIKASKGDMALEPGYIVLDTKSPMDFQIHHFDTAPASEVFIPNAPEIPTVSWNEAQLDTFITELRGEEPDTVLESYSELSDVLMRVLEEAQCSPSVVNIVKMALAQAEGMDA